MERKNVINIPAASVPVAAPSPDSSNLRSKSTLPDSCHCSFIAVYTIANEFIFIWSFEFFAYVDESTDTTGLQGYHYRKPPILPSQKGLVLYEWVIMTNHVHLPASANEGFSMSDIMRDLKKFTSGNIHTAIKEHPGESRRKWMLGLLMEAGIKNNLNASFQLWEQNNHPLPVTCADDTDRVTDHIRMNPAKERIVDRPEGCCYSSAFEPGTLKLDHV